MIICECFKKIGLSDYADCSSLEIVHLPAGVSEFEFMYISLPFDGCDNLKAIYVPKENVDFYK